MSDYVAVTDPANLAEAQGRLRAIAARQAAKARQSAERCLERDRARLTALANQAADQLARAKALADYEREQVEAREAAKQNREDATRDPRRIIARVAGAFNVTARDIDGPSRKAPVVRARFAAIYAIRQANPHYSLNRIGLCVGGRDHSSVRSALRKMDRLGVPQPQNHAEATR